MSSFMLFSWQRRALKIISRRSISIWFQRVQGPPLFGPNLRNRIFKKSVKLDQVNSENLLFEFWSLFFLLSSVKEIKDCNNCGKYSIVHSKDRPLCKWPFVKERRNKFCEEQLSRGTIVTWNNCPECVARDIEGHWYMMVLGQYRVVLAGIWWYWVSMGQYWLLLGDIGSV